jgi:hypothetical protein
VKVVGVRYELNDPYICVLGKLIDAVKPKLKIGEKAEVEVEVDSDSDSD